MDLTPALRCGSVYVFRLVFGDASFDAIKPILRKGTIPTKVATQRLRNFFDLANPIGDKAIVNPFGKAFVLRQNPRAACGPNSELYFQG